MAWQNWDLVVIVGGVDISAQLVDVAPISVEAERSAARIAEFTVLLSGTVDPNDWTGKTVTIDYVDGATTRVFNGVVSDPVLNIADFTLKCTCTDDLQRIVDGKTNAELLTLTGGYWSDQIFNADATGWTRLQDILSTVPVSVELDTGGVLEAHSLQNTVLPDFTFTAADFLDDSIRVELVKRSNLINQVDISFSARFERLFHREEVLNWVWPFTFCEGYARQLKYPVKQMLIDSVNSAGWAFLGATYTPVWATDVYDCGGPIAWTNASPDVLIMGFSATAALRWSQSVTNQFNFSVQATDSITAYGTLAQTLQTSANYNSTIDKWGNSGTDFSTVPAGFAYDDFNNQFRDEIDSGILANALNTLIAVAVERINKSHRSNVVSFALPLAPGIGLQHTIKIDDTNLQAKGIVNRIRHTFELSTAKAVTDIDLLLSSGQSGLDTVSTSWTPPAHPDYSGGSADLSVSVPTNVGGDFGSPAEDSSMWGYFVNATYFTGGPDPATPTYNERMEIKFAALDAGLTQNQTNAIAPANIAIDVPHNLLTISA